MNKAAQPSVQYIIVQPDYSGQRIDNFLITQLKGVPKTRIYRMLRKGEVRVNKKRVQPSYRLQDGDSMRIPPVRMDEKPKPATPAQSLVTFLSERILYEDKYLLILNKPPGIPVHGGTGVSMGIVEALRSMFPKLPHLELAHRLDVDTSGCLILAKKRSILKELHELFREGKVKKIYWALTKGRWKPEEYRVDVPLLKNQLSSGERIVRVNSEGKAALSFFKPLETFSNSTLVEVNLMTGRTHQIRVHAQYRNHQLACDEKYGDKEFNKQIRSLGLKRLFLHAKSIEFVLPTTGEHIKITSNLDTDLEECLNALRNK